MQPKPHPRTTAQALAQQKADAERDRAAAQQRTTQQPPAEALDRFAKPSSQLQQVIVPAAKQTVAVPDNRTSVQQYVDEIAPSSIAGRLIKFSKNGEFVFADTDETVSPDADFIALCDETLVGWIRFHRDDDGATPPDRVMGVLYDGFVMPPRESLGDLNPADWAIGLSGAPEDPFRTRSAWCCRHREPTSFLPMRQPARPRRAIGNLLRHYDRMRRKDVDHYPVVRLKSSGFNHRDPRIGFVPTPLLAVVGTAPKASAAIPDTSPAADLNDQIPF
jgi:hypothetical protein